MTKMKSFQNAKPGNSKIANMIKKTLLAKVRKDEVGKKQEHGNSKNEVLVKVKKRMKK